MQSLNLASFIFLVVVFVLTPRAALRSARQLRKAHADGAALPRMRIVLSTMFTLTIIWFLSQMNALSLGRNLFSVADVGLREIGIGVSGFAVLLLAIPISRAIRQPEEARRRLLFTMVPRNPREFAVFALLAVMAGIAEESAYRGVAVWILTPIFGNILPAIFLSAMAFGVAHAVQGGKTMFIVFAIALVFHALVWSTGTLVVAMVVHAAYDIVAGYAAAQRAQELGITDEPPPAVTPG